MPHAPIAASSQPDWASDWAAATLAWSLMVVAMMVPLVRHPVRITAARSLWPRRDRAIGGFLLALAFLPSMTASLVMMPRPVMGAALLFSACFVIISGLQTITSRMLDARRTIVIGLAIASGVAAERSRLHPR